ncbi:MAG: hypothetical protein V3T72_05695, partial [Thermoanaerobaculia bacterium]
MSPFDGSRQRFASALAIALALPAPAAFCEFLLSDPESEVYYSYLTVAGENLDVDGGASLVGKLHSNGDLRLKAGSTVDGDVSAVGEIDDRGSGSGVRIEGAAALALPEIPEAETLRALADRVFETAVTFTDEIIDDVVFVEGTARFRGDLDGVGTIIATGDILLDSIGGGGFDLDPESRLSLIAYGDIRIAKERRFRGVLRAGRDVRLEKDVVFAGVIVADRKIDVKKDAELEFEPAPDQVPPTIMITFPVDGAVSSDPTPNILIAFEDADSGVALESLEVRLDGVSISDRCQVADDGALCLPASLEDGEHDVTATIEDLAGNTATASVTFTLEGVLSDGAPPTLSILSPSAAEVLLGDLSAVIITYVDAGSGIDASSVEVTLNDVALACSIGPIKATCPLATVAEGTYTVAAEARDLTGNEATASFVFTAIETLPDRTAPRLVILSPVGVSVVGDATPEIRVAFSDEQSGPDPATLVVELDGIDLTPTCLISAGEVVCEPPALTPGSHVVTATMGDLGGNQTTETRVFDLTLALAVTVAAPARLTRAVEITVSGTVAPEAETVEVAGVPALLEQGAFEASGVPLAEGSNTLMVIARSLAGGIGVASVTVVRDTQAPRVVIVNPPEGFVTAASQLNVTGEVVDLSSSHLESTPVSVKVNGIAAALDQRSFLVTGLPLQQGDNTLTVTARDVAGNLGTATRRVRVAAAAGGRIEEIGGNLQIGSVGTALPDPLVVRLSDSLGAALVGRPVTFEVTRGDGALVAFPDAARSMIVRTDANGLATARFTLGRRAGLGNHEVTARYSGFTGSVVFCASATPRAPVRIARIAGDNAMGAQTGIAGVLFPKPLLTQVFDRYGNPVPGVDVLYRVTAGEGSFAGQAIAVASTDADGKASAGFTLGLEEGINNHRVEAGFDDLAEAPAEFVLGAATPGLEVDTAVHGLVLDNADLAVPGVTIGIHGTDLLAVTDDQGRFRLSGVPPGSLVLDVDGSTTTRPGTWPHLEFELFTISGRDNDLGMPIRLLPLDPGARLVGGEQDVTVPMAGVEGAELLVFADSTTFPAGSPTGWLSLTQVHGDKVPMVAPMGSSFMLAWTVQPAGVRFDPPARISIPNIGEAPGTVVDMFSFDHDLGEFLPIGTASVSEDGRHLMSNPGFGVLKSGWHGCVPPPEPPARSCNPGPCYACSVNGPVFACSECGYCSGGEGCKPKEIANVSVVVEEGDRTTPPTARTPPAENRFFAAELVPLPEKQHAKKKTVGLNALITFTAAVSLQGSCPGPLVYAWSFGDGGTGTGKMVGHRFKKRTVANGGQPFRAEVHVSCLSCSRMKAQETWEITVEGDIEIQRLISDQIPGLTCNFLDRGAGPGPNNPMLMGC